jgi:hypothetical protein
MMNRYFLKPLCLRWIAASLIGLAVYKASAGDIITATVVVSDASNFNEATPASLTLSGDTRIWTNSVTSPSTEIQSSTNIARAAFYLLQHFRAYPFSGVLTTATNNGIVLTGADGAALSLTDSNTWATIAYRTQTVATGTIVLRAPRTAEGNLSERAKGDDDIVARLNNAQTNTVEATAAAMVNFAALVDIDTSAELRGILTDESGTGALLFAGGDIAAGTATTPSANDNDTSVATTAYVQAELTAYASDTVTFTGKTFDAAGTGNVLKLTDYKDFVYPGRVDGAGCITGTTNTAGVWGLASYSGSADTNGNYAIFRIGIVPYDLDMSVAMTLKGLKLRVDGSDTDAAQFTIALYSAADSSAELPTDFTGCSNFINFDTGTLTSPGLNGGFTCADVTLTGWASALTAGRPFIIAIARRNGSNDDIVSITSGTISYGRTQ